MKSRETALLVIRFLGWLLILSVAGSLLLSFVGKVAPEWIKDAVMVGIGALSALLAKTEVSGPDPADQGVTITPYTVNPEEIHPN